MTGSRNGEFRGQTTAILPVNYQWSHHYDECAMGLEA
jgi:hypothetical protein